MVAEWIEDLIDFLVDEACYSSPIAFSVFVARWLLNYEVFEGDLFDAIDYRYCGGIGEACFDGLLRSVELGVCLAAAPAKIRLASVYLF